jgi:carboxylesterase type B
MQQRSLMLLVVLANVLLLVHGNPVSAPLIATPCGYYVYGTRHVVGSSFPNISVVDRYAAIPYAKPPVGDLRWRPPQPVEQANLIVDGTVYPSECVQSDGSGSEDCLYLNVIRPQATSENSGNFFPVVVYFHGGGLLDGSAPGNIKDMESLVAYGKDDVVAVTVAYRLNVLGWLAVEELASEPETDIVGNYGLMDAISALKWIKENIKSFGGDPDRIILSGQSSGGTLIFALMATPAAENLFTGAISLSGSANISMNAGAKLKQDSALVDDLGCSGGASPQERLKCLRALPAKTVALATPWNWHGATHDWTTQGMPQPKDGGFNFGGVVYVDGVLVPKSFKESFASGVNSDVGFIFSSLQAEFDVGANNTVANNDEWIAAVKRGFENWNSSDHVVSEILQAYKPESSVDGRLAFSAFKSDLLLTCANINISVYAASKGIRKASTYILYNAWNPSSNTNEGGNALYPYHTLDLKEIGRDWEGENIASDLQISRTLQSMIIDFAYNNGVMPASWKWDSVSLKSVPTLVLSQSDSASFPGFGNRVVNDWKKETCETLLGIGMGEEYWWCD